MVIVVMGVTGAGKTTVGRTLAGALGWRFVDADDLHPRANLEKMARNEALTDADREPWLLAVRAEIVNAHDISASLVVACSALKRRYRQTLSHGVTEITFVYLRASRDALAERLAERRHHFAGPGLLDSQLATLEEPSADEAIVVDATLPLEILIVRVRESLGV